MRMRYRKMWCEEATQRAAKEKRKEKREEKRDKRRSRVGKWKESPETDKDPVQSATPRPLPFVCLVCAQFIQAIRHICEYPD